MSKGKQNRNFGKVKTREKPVFELIRSVLKGAKSSPNYLDNMKQQFVDFVFSYKGEKFNKVYSVLLKEDDFIKVSPVQNIDFSTKPNDLSFENIPFERLLELILTPLDVFSDQIKEFEIKKAKFEQLLICGFDAKASTLLDNIRTSHGDSIWLIRAKMLLLSQDESSDSLYNLIESYKKKGIEDNLFRTLHTYLSLFEVADPNLLLKSTINRDINELIDGEAFNLAAINNLLYLPFPSQFDVHPFFALWGLQQFNYIDIYVFVKEILIQADIIDKTSIDTELDLKFKPKIVQAIASLDRNWNVAPKFKNRHMDWYEADEYKKIIYDLENNLCDAQNLIINLNIYAKSYIYEDQEPIESLPNTLRLCISNLINLYKIQDIQQSLSILNSLVINSTCFDISKHIQIAMEKALSYQSESLNRLKVSFFHKYTHSGNTLASTYLVYSRTDPCISKVSKREIAKCEYLKSPTQDSLNNYLKYKPLDKDVIETKAYRMVLNEEYEELLEYSVSELMKNEQSYICFPMKQISKYIDKNYIETANSVIFYYFYSLFIDKDSTESLNQVFDEYILNMGINRPGDYFDLESPISEKELLILSKIATVNVMDYMGCFKGTSDLMYERIKILTNLKEDLRTDSEKLEIEYQETLNELLIQEATAQLTTAKIFVDKQSITKVNSGKLITLVTQFFQAKDENLIDSNNELLVKINNVLVDLYQVIMTEYLNNQEYGLDSNLSGEIRHTFFSNLLSTKPEDNKLITELGVDNKYESNTYWLEYYGIVNPKIMNDIDSRLKEFSESFNDLIEKAESWMKVSISDTKPERVFIFKDPNSVFESLMDEFLQSKSFNELINIVFNSLDSQLNDCLNAMRTKVNHDFAIALDDLFDDLLSDIERIKQSTSLTNLVNNILNTKNGIKEDVKAASDWFNFRNNKAFNSYPIREVIKISERCFSLNRKNKRNIKLVRDHDIRISGPYVPKFIMALNNCYANAKKHISDKDVIEIEVISGNAGSFKVRIYNNISKQHESFLLSGALKLTQERLKKMNSNSLLSKEGGTGLYKSKFKLVTMSEKFDLKIDTINQKFITEVIFNA
jgi:hypothetical protein